MAQGCAWTKLQVQAVFLTMATSRNWKEGAFCFAQVIFSGEHWWGEGMALERENAFPPEDTLSSSGPTTCSEPQGSPPGELTGRENPRSHDLVFPALSTLCRCSSRLYWIYNNWKHSHCNWAARRSVPSSERRWRSIPVVLKLPLWPLQWAHLGCLTYQLFTASFITVAQL